MKNILILILVILQNILVLDFLLFMVSGEDQI